MAGLGLEVSDLDGYLDKVASTASNANTDIDALMEAFVIAGGTFDRLNVPLEESNAFLGVLANRGFKGSEAGTAINAIMSRLTKETGPAADALEEMGVAVFDSEGKFRGMETVMRDVEKATDSMTDEQRENALTQIAGLNHGKSFNAMLSGLGDEYGELKGKIIDSDGALKTMRDTMKDNLQGALENLSSAFEEIMISLGSALIPIVEKLVGWLQQAADWFNGLSENTKTTIAIVLAITAGLALLIGPILLLVGFIPAIIAGFQAVGVVLAVLTGPVGLIIAAIVAIGAALVLAYNKVEWFREMVDEAWAMISEIFGLALDWIKDKVDVVMSAVSDLIGEILERIMEYWDKYGELIMAGVELAFSFIKGYIDFIMNNIMTIIKTAWTIISGVIEVAWGLIVLATTTTMDVVMGIIDTIMALITGDWEGAWNAIKGIGEDIWANIEKFFSDVDLVQIGKDMLQGLIDGIKNMAGNVTGAIKDVVGGAISGAKSLLGIKSPSRVFKDIGSDTGEGLAIGISDMQGAVAQATQSLADSATATDFSLDYATPSGLRSSLTSAVNGSVDVNTREDVIAGAIASLERKLTDLRVDMDGETVGRITRPHINGGNALDGLGRYFD